MWQRSLQTAVPLQSWPKVILFGSMTKNTLQNHPPKKTKMEWNLKTSLGKGEKSLQSTNFLGEMLAFFSHQFVQVTH